MRTLARSMLALSLIAILWVTSALPAVGAQLITYRGMTSQDRRVSIEVVERDGGRRSLWHFKVHFTLTCEDATLRKYGVTWRFTERLDKDGSFEVKDRIVELLYAFSLSVDGTVRWRSAVGTFEFKSASLTDDDEAQLCTTGIVAWFADRDGSSRWLPTRPPSQVGFLGLGRDRGIKLTEP